MRIDREIQQTEESISVLEQKRLKLRNQVRHETDPTALADNKAQRAAITNQIASLRQRIKCLTRIRKDVPRLLNLLKTELQVEYNVKHPVKEQQKNKVRSHDQIR